MLDISGSGGMLAAGSRRIAEVGDWRLKRSGRDGWSIELEPRRVDTFWWSSSNVRVSIAFGERRWVWGVASLPSVSDRITVEVEGPPETFP